MSDPVIATQPAAQRPKRRILLRLLRGLLVFVVLSIVTWIVADQVMLRKAQQKREVFRERFGNVDFRDFIPARPDAEADTGRLYSFAIALMAKASQEYGDWSMYHALTDGPESFRTRGDQDVDVPTPDELDTKVREKMAAMDEAFRVVEEARALDRGSIVQNFELDDRLQKELSAVRQLAQNVDAKAVFEARAGNLDAACAWLESGLHVAATMEEDPYLIVQLVRIAVIQVAAGAAEQVFNASDAPLPLSTRYWTLLDRVSDPAVYRRGLASEASYAISQKMPVPRLFWSANELKMIDFYLALDEVLGLESRSERRAGLDAFPQLQATGPMLPTNFLVPLLAPAIVRGVDTYDRMTAQCDFIRLAASLRTWKSEHGAYPDALDALAKDAQSPPPLDPFSGKAYRYRREGDGFVLYSVGDDRTDDGGVEGEKRDKGDIVWTCVR